MVDGIKDKKTDEAKVEEVKAEETKVETAKEETKKAKKKEVKAKDVAIANGFSLKISPKQCIYVCRIIMGKSPEMAIARLQSVLDERRPVPMAGLEIGHRKGKGLAGGRFPKNACKGVMDIVKQVGANAVTNGIENPVITIARSDRASAPFRRNGRRGKRAHIHLEVRDKKSLVKKKIKGAKK